MTSRNTPRPSRLGFILVLTMLATAALAATASAAIVPKDSADEVAQAIIADPSTLNLATTDWHERPLTSDPGDPPVFGVTSGIGDSSLADFPTAGSTFGLLTSGDPTIADRPNDGEGDGTAVEFEDNGAPRGDTDHDTTVIKVGVNVPAGTNCLSLDYRFLSEEFPEFVGSPFNDAFIGELDTTQWSTSGSTINKPGDFATATGGEPVSVNGVGPVVVSEAEAAGTTYDAATGLVTTKTPITPGQHLVYLSIFDQGDPIYDSAIFLDRLSFISEAPSTCRPPEVPVILPAPPTPTPTPAPVPPPSNAFTLGGGVVFKNGSTVLTINVPGPGTVTATQTGATSARARAAAKKKVVLVKSAKATAKKAGPVKLTLKPTKAGKKVLRRRGKLTAKMRITYKPTGGVAKSTTKKITIKSKKRKRR